ncbi:30S ribosomal protein S6 [Nocardioides panacisoli]|uniref:30S ribosomal protein S6 n=1 Tax=Nocardioides panacisoli TaxID=627624 RepID=UPI001C625EC7|nr:30S ribosomal protein S6 [Nocardioides panacisoli]QYJ03316.1 30S ribosomal protein S6 [Nocardioides panacisoli]
MRNYEVMVILDPSIDERRAQPSLTKYLDVITEAGGTIANVDVWGRRRLAYEINKHAEGIYVVIDLTAATETVKEFERRLNLDESVLRLKVLKPTAVAATAPSED